MAAAVAGCSFTANSNGYWYCWNSGPADPHHLGRPVSSDHLCSAAELRAAGFASNRSTTQTSSGSLFPATVPADTSPSPTQRINRRRRKRRHPAPTPAPVPTIATNTTISPPPTPEVSQSHPVLIGSPEAASGPYSVTIDSIQPDHDLDVPGFGGPPQFGVALKARCTEPSTLNIVTWKLAGGGGPGGQTTEVCFNGTFNIGRVPTSFSLTGCGQHTLTMVPETYGTSLTSPSMHPLSNPMRFTIHEC